MNEYYSKNFISPTQNPTYSNKQKGLINATPSRSDNYQKSDFNSNISQTAVSYPNTTKLSLRNNLIKKHYNKTSDSCEGSQNQINKNKIKNFNVLKKQESVPNSKRQNLMVNGKDKNKFILVQSSSQQKIPDSHQFSQEVIQQHLAQTNTNTKNSSYPLNSKVSVKDSIQTKNRHLSSIGFHCRNELNLNQSQHSKIQSKVANPKIFAQNAQTPSLKSIQIKKQPTEATFTQTSNNPSILLNENCFIPNRNFHTNTSQVWSAEQNLQIQLPHLANQNIYTSQNNKSRNHSYNLYTKGGNSTTFPEDPHKQGFKAEQLKDSQNNDNFQTLFVKDFKKIGNHQFKPQIDNQSMASSVKTVGQNHQPFINTINLNNKEVLHQLNWPPHLTSKLISYQASREFLESETEARKSLIAERFTSTNKSRSNYEPSKHVQRLHDTSIMQNASTATSHQFPQTNSKNSLAFCNQGYGKKTELQLRKKAHLKKYSNAQTRQKQYKNNDQNQKKQIIIMSKHSTPLSSQPQSLQEVPKIPTQNLNPGRDKGSTLDSIAEKDEFNKIFVRDINRKNQAKKYNQYTQQYIQRKNDYAKLTHKQKPTISFENPIINLIKVKYATPNETYPHNFIFKSPKNSEYLSPSQQQKLLNYQKYVKIYSYDPIIQTKKNQTINRKKAHGVSSDYLYDVQSTNNDFNENNNSQSSSLDNRNRIRKIDQYPKSAVGDSHYQKNESNEDDVDKSFKYRYKYDRNKSAKIYGSYKSFYNQCSANSQTSSVQNEDSPNKILDFGSGNLQVSSSNNDQKYKIQSFEFNAANPSFNHFYWQKQGCKPIVHFNHKKIDYNQINSSHQKISGINDSLNQTQKNGVYFNSPQSQNETNHKNIQSTQQSHFQQEQKIEREDSKKKKKSIRKMLVSQSKGNQQKAEVFYNYNFEDLLKGQESENKSSNRTILQILAKNQFTKIFCSTLKIGQNENGCDCAPKCYVIDQWLEKIQRNPLIKTKSLLKNCDKNRFGVYLNIQSLWKNKGDDEAVSFSDLYRNMTLSQDQTQNFKQIEKDIPRTCSNHPTFKNKKYKDLLRELLINFYYLDSKLGYVQGMNFIASSLIYHSKTVHQSLQMMDFIMNVLNFKNIYLNEMKMCKQLAAKTCHYIKHYCFDLYSWVVVDNQVDLEIFILGWFFSMFGTFVPLEAMHLVINKFIDQRFEGLVQIIVSFFIFIKENLMKKNDPNQIMEELSIQSMIEKSKKIDWELIITASEKLHVSLEKESF